MDMPRELKWIGPLFAILYISLWLRRGPTILIGFILPITPVIAFWPLQVIVGLVIAFVVFAPRYRVTTLIVFLSFFWSGILIEYIPIPYYGPFPPPPTAIAIPNVLISPVIAIPALFSIFLQPISYVSLISIVGLTLLVLLGILTVLVTEQVSNGKIDVVRSMLFYVTIIVCWTFLYLLIMPQFGAYTFFTPMPLGPLLALNLLPWIKLRSRYMNGKPVR
jgi:hypothetical protein